jgi:hypothetical protein
MQQVEGKHTHLHSTTIEAVARLVPQALVPLGAWDVRVLGPQNLCDPVQEDGVLAARAMRHAPSPHRPQDVFFSCLLITCFCGLTVEIKQPLKVSSLKLSSRSVPS